MATIAVNIAYCESKIDEIKQRIKMSEVSGESLEMLSDRQKGYEKALRDYKGKQSSQEGTAT